MKVLISGGSKTSNIVNAISKRFEDGGVEFEVVNFFNELENYYNKGKNFDKAIILEQSLNLDYNIVDEMELRNNINEFAKIVKEKSGGASFIFIAREDAVANTIHDEILEIRGHSAIVVKEPKYTVSFFVTLISNDVDKLPEEIVFDAEEYARYLYKNNQVDDNKIEKEENNKDADTDEYNTKYIDDIDRGIEELSSEWKGINLKKEESKEQRSLGEEGSGSFGADFGEADLGDTDLGDAGFGDADFGDADFEDADFGDADFGDADFGDADFGDEDFSKADLGDADFSKADLGDTDFGDVDFGKADLGDADFGEADLGDTDFGDADFGDADDKKSFEEECTDKEINEYEEPGGIKNEYGSIDVAGFEDNSEDKAEKEIESSELEKNEYINLNKAEGKSKINFDKEDSSSETGISDQQGELYNEDYSNIDENKKEELEYNEQYNQPQPNQYNEQYNQPQPNQYNEQYNDLDDIEYSARDMLSSSQIKQAISAFAGRGNTIMFTGCGGSGNSTVVFNIANTIANMGYSVLIVDLDLERKTQSYISAESFDSVDPYGFGVMAAINSTSGINAHVSVVRQGLHLLTMGMASDSVKFSEVIQKEKINRFINMAKMNYNFVLYDCPFDIATTDGKDFTFMADNVVITIDYSNWGILKTLVEMCNIENGEVQEVLFNKGQILFNRYNKKKKIIGKVPRKNKEVVKQMDNKVRSLIGQDPGFHFSDMHICGVIPQNDLIDSMWGEKKQYSDTREGSGIMSNILQNIVLKI